MTKENIFSKSKHAEIFEEETETLHLASLCVALSLSFLCKVYEKLERHLYLQLQELKIHLVRCDILRYGTNPLISFFFFPFSFSVIFFFHFGSFSDFYTYFCISFFIEFHLLIFQLQFFGKQIDTKFLVTIQKSRSSGK